VGLFNFAGQPQAAAPPSLFNGAPAPADGRAAADNVLRGMQDAGLLPRQHRRGLFGSRVSGEDLQLTFMMAQAAMNGDTATMARIQGMRQQADASRAEQEAAYDQRRNFMINLLNRGMSREDAELAALNPGKFSEEWATRFRTRDMAQGHTARTPGIGHQPGQSYTAPLFIEDGPNRVAVDPNTGASRIIHQGRTDAEHEAERLGLQPGSPDWQRYIRDRLLDAQGPTAVEMNRERLGVTMRGQDISSRDRQRGQDISSSDRRRGQDISSGDRRRGQDLTHSRGVAAEQGRNSRFQQGEAGRNTRHSTPRPRSTGNSARAVLNGRTIVVRGNRWVYEDNGQPAQ
jgi:hypothetical protein